MKLVFIGDGESRGELEKLAHGLDCEFVGQFSHENVLSRCGEAKAVVSPSSCWETFGLVSVEAQSVGTPCVVSDLGGLPDTVGAKLNEEGIANSEEGRRNSGLVVKHGDAEALVRALARMLDMPLDEWQKMSDAGRLRVKEFYTEEANFKWLKEIYGDAKRVLLVHNFYGSSAPSGENKVFDAEREMLEKHGIEVEVYTRHSDEIRSDGRVEACGLGKGFLAAKNAKDRRGSGRFCRLRKLFGMVKGALCTVGNPFAARAVAKKCREFKPDVVHFHNTFPLISPLAVRAAHKCGCKVVMTLHNYRTLCAAGVPTRCGKVCTECFCEKVKGKGKRLSVVPAIQHRCYRGSLFATLPLALNIWLYRNLWCKWVDAFIVLSEFQKRKMIECGWPEEKLAVKGNFTELSPLPIVPAKDRKDEIVFVGRLSKEKGIFTLVEAWRKLAETRGDVS